MTQASPIQSEIRVLPALVVDQIAAGEVVERPASVVKELLDNAIDAGAGRITVELEKGGIELVRVADDGAGIAAGQLGLAVHPHATSKIRSTEDLDRIATMGFRGEALASIASVSRLSIRSRARGEEGASIIEVEGGSTSPVRPDAGPVGTVVTVRNLFFNTPARRKFLKTPTTEQGHCVDLIRALALSHPAIGFVVRCDGRVVLDVPSGQAVRERAFAILGREMETQYVEVHADRFDDARGVALWGLAGLPVLARPTTRWQHLFLNGRPIRDRTVQHALREAYRGLIEPSRQPAALLMLEMDPGAVDVNVHPAKAEVRFRDSGMVHKAVYLAVREALRSTDLTAREDTQRFRFEPVMNGGTPTPGSSAVGERFAEYFERFVPDAAAKQFDYEGIKRTLEEERAQIERENARLEEERRRIAASAPDAPEGARARTPDMAGQHGLVEMRPGGRILQVHNSFLVTQDEQGMVIIDQHALHERVMYEKISERLATGAMESQRLLVPETVEATVARVDLVESLGALLERLGIDATPAGPRSVSVHAFPTFLFDKKVEPGAFVGELLERAEADGWDRTVGDGSASAREEMLHEIVDMMACKAAIKAGDRLSEQELDELLAMRDRVERSSNCPHGRPTAIRLTIRELERQFGRS